MTADDLVDIAAELLQSPSGRRKQAAFKRAVSTAYYALFHALAYNCVDSLLGWRMHADNYWDVVTPLYRLIDHGSAKKVFLQVKNDPASSPELRRVGVAFTELQADRMLADYDPRPGLFGRGDALQRIEQARDAIQDLRSLSADIRRTLAVQLISKQR